MVFSVALKDGSKPAIEYQRFVAWVRNPTLSATAIKSSFLNDKSVSKARSSALLRGYDETEIKHKLADLVRKQGRFLCGTFGRAGFFLRGGDGTNWSEGQASPKKRCCSAQEICGG